MIRLSLLALLLILPGLASAEEPFIYQPENCSFSVTFPSEPETKQICDGNGGKCFERLTHTTVYGLSSTVNFRVSCNPVDAQVQKQYDEELMKATVRAMSRKSLTKTSETAYRETENYKLAGLVGEGEQGLTPLIYIAQMWLGKTSALSVEAELIGESHEDADKLFSDVLRSLHFVDEEAPKP